MKITIVDINYISLSLAVVLARKHEVWITDSSVKKITDVNLHKCPFSNPSISRILSKEKPNLNATIDLQKACENSDFIVVCTPTTFNTEIDYFDTNSLNNSIKRVLKYSNNVPVIIRATVPVGYTEKMNEKYKTDRLIFYPEFIREKSPVRDILYPSRIVVGANKSSKEMQKKTKEFIDIIKASALKKNITSIIMSTTEAETTKLFVNTYIAMRIAFFNDLDTFAEVRNMETKKILKGICSDPVMGKDVEDYGFGYGACYLPKGMRNNFIDYEYKNKKSTTVIADSAKSRVDFINDILNKNDNMTVGIYMLSKYKKFDCLKKYDIEGIIKSLIIRGKKVVIYDPTLKDYEFCGARVIKGLDNFKEMSDVIISEKVIDEFIGVSEKIFTPDAYIKIYEMNN